MSANSWKDTLLTKAFRGLFTPTTITPTPTPGRPMQFELLKTRVVQYATLGIIIAFLGGGVSAAIHWIAWVWAANILTN